MGKPNSHGNSFSDNMSLHSNIGESSITAPYVDDDAPEIDIDDLPPNYSDAIESIESYEAAPMLSPGSATNDTIRPSDLDARVVIDQNSGAQAWVAKSVEDPRRLETYTRQLSGIPPRPYMNLVGTHTETTKDSKGKNEKNTVTDFDVTVELTPYLFADAQYRKSWSQLRTVDNREKVHRGTIRAKRQGGSNQSIEIGADVSPTLQEWCHRFAASPAGLKCFTFQRQMVGFDEEGVKHRLEGLVRGTNYRGHLRVQLITKDARIDFYNDAKINRWRLTPWIRWMFFLTLTFIFSWPYLIFRTKRWEVVVAEWPFSRTNESGNREYVSLSEDQWYNMWAQAICRAVLEKRQTLLDQSDLRRAHEANPAFNTGDSNVDGALGLFRAGIHAMNEVNRQLGWGGDC
ncbi:hypothetical protein E0Z10_g9041 [Xylaria hypoxylon]|uniref:Uncharacterized protein n=1 Tax=Xylaria hypoxylon TaxID=37992 RepID=A0A4Z0Y9T4_9PEZI|nr:hypothetical protein E0Z10_g9041 [Xylaria hypoxylon]